MKDISLSKKLKITFFAIMVCFIWVFIIPSIVAYLDKVFFDDQLEQKLPTRANKAVNDYRKYEQTANKYKSNLRYLDSVISGNNGKQKKELVLDAFHLKSIYKKELSELKSPITVSGFFNNKSIYYTFGAHFFLVIVVCLLLPAPLSRLRYLQVAKLTLLIYIAWMFTNWLRAWLFYDEGRTIFSFVNLDISVASFILQEFRILGVSLLIAIIWCSWTIYNEDVYNNFKLDATKPIIKSIGDFSFKVAELFKYWQLTSVAIGGAFLPWTFFYWGNLVLLKDSRYTITAIIVHLYWAITWVMVTIPVIIVYKRWIMIRTDFISDSFKANSNFDKRIQFINEINPLSGAQIFGSAIVSIVSFVLPFIEFFLKH